MFWQLFLRYFTDNQILAKIRAMKITQNRRLVPLTGIYFVQCLNYIIMNGR